MMRMNGALFALAAAALAAWVSCASSDHGAQHQVDAHAAVCGDGVCEPSEVSTCSKDCGMPGSAGACNHDGICDPGETAASCADCTNQTGSGSGSGSATGSGSGTSTLNCNDQNTVLACFACLGGGPCVGGVSQSACQACFGSGSGSGSGFGSGSGSGSAGPCDFNGICDNGETHASCPADCP